MLSIHSSINIGKVSSVYTEKKKVKVEKDRVRVQHRVYIKISKILGLYSLRSIETVVKQTHVTLKFPDVFSVGQHCSQLSSMTVG